MDPITATVPIWDFHFTNHGHVRALPGERAFALTFEGAALGELDLQTGTQCWRVVPELAPAFQYAQNLSNVGRIVIGPSRFDVVAYDLATGKVRWKKALLDARFYTDEYALRDTLTMATFRDALVLRFMRMTTLSPFEFRWDEVELAVNPQTSDTQWERDTPSPKERPVQREGTTVVLSDGEHLIEQTKGLVRARIPNTGALLWSQPHVGAGTFAGEGRVLTVLPDQAVDILDGATGKHIANIRALGGNVQDALFGADTVYLAVHGSLGQSTVTAVDLRTGEIRWTYNAVGSVQHLQAITMDRSLLAYEGDGRVAALDARTGGRIAGLYTGIAMPVWSIETAHGSTAVIATANGAKAFSLTQGTALVQTPAYLRWSFLAPQRATSPATDTAPTCTLHALSRVHPDGHVAWTRELPARMKIASDCNEANHVMGLPAIGTPSSIFTVHELAGTIAIADVSGVAAFRESTGALTFSDEVDEKSQSIFFDRGSFVLGGTEPCKGEAHGPNIFARCGEMLFYFNGFVAALIDTRRWKVIDKTTIPASRWTHEGASTRVSTTLAGRSLVIQGVTFMR